MQVEEVGEYTVFTMSGCSPVEPFSDYDVANCYSVSLEGFLPRFKPRVSDRPGAGLPIAGGSASVKTALLGNFEISGHDSASFMRLAAYMADKEIFPRAVSWGPETALFNRGAWEAEMMRQGGRLNYYNSVYLNSRVAGEVSFSFIGRESFRPLLVSSNLSWGTKAVFEGYREALLSLDVGVATFEYDEYARNFSTEIVRKILLGEICNKQLGFTHAIFIDGLSIPPWLVDSSPLTNILVSTEDPHALDVTRLLYPHYDYVFSNEKNAAEAFGVHYLPVAADPKAVDGLPNPVPEQYESDVLFLGAIYPSRMKVLEEIAEICERRGWRFRIVGPRHCCSPGGRVAEIVDERIVPTREALLYQAGAKVCLNLFRDPAEGHNAEFGLQGWSMNPRCYDVPLCGSSLLTDFRGEVKRVFGMDCVMNRENLETQLEKNLQDASGRKEKASQEVKTVLDGHLYVHRALVLAACIGQGFLVPAQ